MKRKKKTVEERKIPSFPTLAGLEKGDDNPEVESRRIRIHQQNPERRPTTAHSPRQHRLNSVFRDGR